ncbi:MAG: bifunctional folylpolyglutamate synthase/dihydrofolate synthase [Actinomycetota bacterium]|nr:bifunctional folylpolyglutamate synthase/dihydrofolate synthase [Actinomycetota bacterium]
MDYTEALAYLDRHIALGVKPGLERMHGLLEAMGRPDEGYPIIHVAGTNGKTSTSRLATLLLVAHGLTTGTYISPHLQRVEERLAVNGRIATEEEFALAVSDVEAFALVREQQGFDSNTYFELITAAAFAFFANQPVQAAVLEVGLGGRLDATNVVDAEVCVVTSIGIEHTEYLGPDLASIAGEKVAIAGLNSILITGPLPEPALDVAEARARELGIHHRHYGKDFSVLAADRGVGGWLVSIDGAEDTYEDVFLPLHGRHQIVNLANSIAAAEALLGRKLDAEAVRDAAASATMPGRMETLGTEPLLMVDGAHNTDGIDVLIESLFEEFPTKLWQVVFGVMGDKNVEAMVERLADVADGFVVTAPESERAVPPGELAERVAAVTDLPVMEAGSVEHAIEIARRLAGLTGAVLVTGSLYLVGEVRNVLVGISPSGGSTGGPRRFSPQERSEGGGSTAEGGEGGWPDREDHH